MYCAAGWALEGFCDVSICSYTLTNGILANYYIRASPSRLHPSTSKSPSSSAASKSAFSPTSSPACRRFSPPIHHQTTAHPSFAGYSTTSSLGFQTPNPRAYKTSLPRLGKRIQRTRESAQLKMARSLSQKSSLCIRH